MIDRAYGIVRWRIWFLAGALRWYYGMAEWEYAVFRRKAWKSGKK